MDLYIYLFPFKRWVKCYRQGLMEIIVNTNNGVERKNKDFKYEYLAQYRDNSLSGMISVLVEQFLPEKYKRYIIYFFCSYAVQGFFVSFSC